MGPGGRLAFVTALLIVGLGRPAVSEACTGPAHGLTVLAPIDEAVDVPLTSGRVVLAVSG